MKENLKNIIKSAFKDSLNEGLYSHIRNIIGKPLSYDEERKRLPVKNFTEFISLGNYVSGTKDESMYEYGVREGDYRGNISLKKGDYENSINGGIIQYDLNGEIIHSKNPQLVIKYRNLALRDKYFSLSEKWPIIKLLKKYKITFTK
jgi:hypothetical protein